MKLLSPLLVLLIASCASQPKHIVHVTRDAKGALDVTVVCPPDRSNIIAGILQLLTLPLPFKL